MIWSMKSAELKTNYGRLQAARMFQRTRLLPEEFAKRDFPGEPVNYLEIPPLQHTIGKLVVPFVALDPRGFLIDSLPAFYGVTKRPDTGQIDMSVVSERSREAHVTAEDLAFRRGIFTPFARASSETLVSDFVPEGYRDSYIQDRIAHLEALRQEAGQSPDLHGKQTAIVVDELSLGIDALTNRLG